MQALARARPYRELVNVALVMARARQLGEVALGAGGIHAPFGRRPGRLRPPRGPAPPAATPPLTPAPPPPPPPPPPPARSPYPRHPPRAAPTRRSGLYPFFAWAPENGRPNGTTPLLNFNDLG